MNMLIRNYSNLVFKINSWRLLYIQTKYTMRKVSNLNLRTNPERSSPNSPNVQSAPVGWGPQFGFGELLMLTTFSPERCSSFYWVLWASEQPRSLSWCLVGKNSWRRPRTPKVACVRMSLPWGSTHWGFSWATSLFFVNIHFITW